MKATGIVRRMDKLGRVCIPAEIRRAMKLTPEDSVEYFLDGDRLVLKKYDAAGDLEQILDGAERSIRQQSCLLPATTQALLEKLKEMKAIVKKAAG